MYTSIISAKECAQNINDPDWCFVDCRFSIDDEQRGERDYRALDHNNICLRPQ